MIQTMTDIAKTLVIARFGEWQLFLYRECEAPAEPIPSSAGASISRKTTLRVEFYPPLVFSLILGLILTGCNKPTVEKEISTSAAKSLKIGDQALGAESSTKARAILEACIAKYKGLKSYEDVGVLSIYNSATDSTDRKRTSEPMRIAFEAPNRLAIQAIALQAMWSSSTWEAIVDTAEFKPFGNQRLVRPLPDRIDLTWLIVDNLGASLNAPVTGLPIQVQLLFDDKPLAYLLVADSKFTLLAPEIFDSAKCDRVQVVLEESKWVFWIDQENRLLRKVELPFPGSPEELAVELVGAKANSSVDWSVWQIPKRADDLLVRRFIDAPLHDTPPLVGKELKPFDLRGADGKVILDSAQRTKLITVLCWVTNDELGEKFVKYLFGIQRELEKRLLNNAEIVLVSQVKAAEMQESLVRWNCSLPLAIDTENLTRSLFSIQHQPAVIILDKLVRVQHFDELGYLDWIPNIVEDLQRGVDIASRRLQTEIDNQARFNSRLHRAMVEKSQIATLPPIESFPFTYHVSKEAWHVPFSDAIIAASGEHYYPQDGLTDSAVGLFAAGVKRQRLMTALDELGHVYCVDNSGVKNWVANIPIEQADNAKRIHVLPDPWTHRWIAVVPEGLPRYWLIDASASADGDSVDAAQYDLHENETPIAFAWTVKDNVPSLTIGTSSLRIRNLDPQSGKATLGEAGAIASMVPSINDRGEVLGWNAITMDGEIREVEDLRSRLSSLSEGNPELKSLPFAPYPSEWAWGRHHSQGLLLGMAQLPSGETGTILQSRLFAPILRHPLSVRPEQCKIHSTATLSNGSLYWLSTAPNRVLHLQTADGNVADQMSLGKRIISAGLFPDQKNLRVVIAIDKEVNCWSIEPMVVKSPPVPANVPAPLDREAISPSEQPGE